MSSTSDRLAGLRILIVEDEAVVAEGIKERLLRRQCEVVGIVDTGEDAIEAARDLGPELVLMDIRLRGELDGIRAGGEIQQRLGVPIVYLTAHSDQATLERAINSGPSGYVLKPFREAELLVALEMALQRHREAQRLRDHNLTFAQVVASLGEAAIVTDAEGRVAFSNPAAAALTGWTAEEAAGRGVDEVLALTHGDRSEFERHPASQVCQTGETLDLTEACLLTTRSGGQVPVRGTVSPIHNELGKLVGAVVTLQDVSTLRALERKLLQTQKLEAIGLLAGGIAHDFNNLLTVIELHCDLLQGGGSVFAAADHDHVETILETAEVASHLARQLLVFSRGAGAAPRPLELGEVVGAFRGMLRRLLTVEIELEVQTLAEGLFVVADRAQLEQVLINLVLNARDAISNAGRVEVLVDAGKPSQAQPASASAEDYAFVSVSDDGCGIEEEIRDRIFEPFFTTKELGRGRGLGLATVFGVVSHSGGVVEVDSEVGRGSTFRVFLPRTKERPAKPAKRPEKVPAGDSGRILLVEDEDGVRRVVRLVLENAGLDVVEAADGQEALDTWTKDERGFDLVLTDIVMPRMGGRELVAALRLRDRRVKALYMSGHEPEAVRRNGQDNGAETVLRKPFQSNHLIAVVREALDDPARS